MKKYEGTYNGWKNFDTWKVIVNLENNYDFYKKATTKKRQWTNIQDFKNNNSCYMVDRVNWSKVSATELKQWYNELIK